MAPLNTSSATAAASHASAAPGSIAAVASAIAAAWHPWIAIAIAVLLIVQYLDIVSGTRAAQVEGTYREERRRRAVADKMLRNTQLLGGLLIDLVLISAGATSFFLLTGGCTAFLIRDEWRSYRRNMQRALGPGAVWDGYDQADVQLARLGGGASKANGDISLPGDGA